MPRVPRHALVWSHILGVYELFTRGQREQCLHRNDDAAWQAWLCDATSFAFHGVSGSLNVYHETRSRGGRYWYAYHSAAGRTRKRYLGPMTRVTLAHLEAAAASLAREFAPSGPFSTDTRPAAAPLPVFSTSLAPPQLSHAVVERTRLRCRLDGAWSTPLTVLSAAAGWGKTTLLALWARRQTRPVAWLSVSEPDLSPPRLWIAVIAALRRCGAYAPNLGSTAAALLQSPQPPPLAACLAALLQDLDCGAAQPGPVALIVDDYQAAGDVQNDDGFAFFLDHLPAHLHVVVSSRIDPSFPLARWRVGGQLTEIRAAEFRFDVEEAHLLLSSLLSTTLAEEEVRVLLHRTEGWAAGLHLAALAARHRPDSAERLHTMTGSHSYVLDYVQDEILNRLPGDVRDFLLQTAVVLSLDAHVCQAVTAMRSSEASQHMLVALERANLFLVPLDEQRGAYRMHDLFREALLAVLHATLPAQVPVLHHRAAQYYAAREQWADAIGHAFAAADFALAATLLAQSAEQFWLRGEAARVARWVLALPLAQLQHNANLALTTSLYLLNTVTQTTLEQRERTQRQARELMARIASAAQMPPTASGDDAQLQRRLGLLRMFSAGSDATARGDLAYLLSLEPEIEQALEREAEPIWQMVPLAYSFVLHFAIRGEAALLLPRLLDAKEQAFRSGSYFALLKIMQWLAMGAVQAGQLRLAYRECLAALDIIEQLEGFALLKGYFEFALAQVLYQWNRLDEARIRLDAVLQAAAAWHAWHQVDLLGAGYIEVLRVALARRDASLAHSVLRQVEDLARRERFGHQSGWLPAVRAQCWLAEGRLDEAAAWAETAEFPVVTWVGATRATFRVVIRVHFAQRRWREAAALLERWRDRLDQEVPSEDTIAYLAQSLVALHHTGADEQARATALRLFVLTQSEGHIRVYLDEGEPMRQAIRALRLCSGYDPLTKAYVETLLAAFDRQEHGSTPSPLSMPRATPVSRLILTQREREVLRLLATGASNQEIAQTLVIEVSTVKKHVSSLLSKLDAGNRTRAIAAARARGLL